MGQIVRRAAQLPAHGEVSSDQLPAKTHSAGGIFVQSQVVLGIEPRLLLSWAVVPSYWTQGYRLLVFHSTAGFSPERYPDDLNRHGQLIIETNRDAWREERPEEGTHYYTFLLHKRCLLGLSEKLSILRFSETIPSARVAIGRIRNKLELEEMRRRHEIAEIAHEAEMNETEIRRLRSRERLAAAQGRSGSGIDEIVGEELRTIDAAVEALFAKRKKIQDLKQDPRFRKLKKHEKKAVLERLEERLDAGEIGARREMRDT